MVGIRYGTCGPEEDPEDPEEEDDEDEDEDPEEEDDEEDDEDPEEDAMMKTYLIGKKCTALNKITARLV